MIVPTGLALAETGKPEPGMQEYLIRGQQALHSGHLSVAIDMWEKALELAPGTGANNRLPAIHGQLASTYLRDGQYPQAYAHLEAALDAAKSLDDPLQTVRLKRQLGSVYLADGRIDEAQTRLDDALDLAEQYNNQALLAAIFNDLGNLKTRQRAYPEALDFFSKGAASARSAGNHLLAAKALSNAAAAALESGQYKQARSLIERARQDAGKTDDSHDKAFALLRLGVLLQDLQRHSAKPGDRINIYKLFSSARDIAESLNDSNAGAYASGYLATLYEEAGRTAEALELGQRAIFLAQLAGLTDSLYRWQWLAARQFREQGKENESLAHYRLAVATIEQIRNPLLKRVSTDEGIFSEGVTPLYREYVSLLLELAISASAATVRNEYLGETQAAMEQLNAAELQDYFQDECVVAARKKTRQLDSALSPGTVAIYPVVLEDRIVLLMTFTSGMEAVTVIISEEQFNAEVAAFRRKLEKRTTREYLVHARQLYDWLIRPIESSLHSHDIKTIVLVPGGALRTIPIAALHDGESFLVEKFASATTPGLELTDPRPIVREDIRILMSGLTAPTSGFGALPYVEDELDAIQELYDSHRLQDESFLKTEFRSSLEGNDYAVVHIASHGKFDAETSNSFLLTYDGQLKLDELERYMSVSRYRENPVELLTLSACQTAAGDNRAALGLAGVAVKAGARSALATLWAINDHASAELVTEFYRQLQDDSRTKARALQLAQNKMLQDQRYRHPGYWSAFLLIGNWL
jgi:CHAT domain-containing protein